MFLFSAGNQVYLRKANPANPRKKNHRQQSTGQFGRHQCHLPNETWLALGLNNVFIEHFFTKTQEEWQRNLISALLRLQYRAFETSHASGVVAFPRIRYLRIDPILYNNQTTIVHLIVAFDGSRGLSLLHVPRRRSTLFLAAHHRG